MIITDALHYAVIGNPVSKAIIDGTWALFYKGTTTDTTSAIMKASAENTSKIVGCIMPPLWMLVGRNLIFVRLAGVSGASAVLIGSLGNYMLNPKSVDTKTIFDAANRFHFFNSLALLAVPMAKDPFVTGTLMFSGTLLFSGPLYYHAFSGNKHVARFAGVGGALLFAAWLSLLA